MDIREATAADADRIRSIARNSLHSSYTHFLEKETIDDALEQWYGEDLPEHIEDDGSLFLVAESDDVDTADIVAFSQSELITDETTVGSIHWIHVDPPHRGSATGVRLLSRTCEELLDEGADEIRSVVLAGNEVGNEFYETQGFERVGSHEITVGEETHTEHIYTRSSRDVDDEWRVLEAIEGDGQTLYVSYGEAVRGSDAPFYTTYLDEAGGKRYGWFCGECNSFDNAMDSMGRIVCNECGNLRKATRWDASYL